jgi:hypothetical protein
VKDAHIVRHDGTAAGVAAGSPRGWFKPLAKRVLELGLGTDEAGGEYHLGS